MTGHAIGVLASAQPGPGEAAFFWILGPLAVLAALGLVLARSAVHAALFLAVDMLGLAVFYAAQKAPFLAFVQVIVYTGAIMMLFLFVLMLVGVDSSDSLVETLRGQRVAAILLGIGFSVLLITAIGSSVNGVKALGVDQADSGHNVTSIADLLFSRYVFAFEATSALLITAALGAMVLAHRERLVPAKTQRELMQQRFSLGGPNPAPLPGPGVYADHDSVDTPALLPGGEVATNSVSGGLRISPGRPHVERLEKEVEP
ncbi:MAG TPA: NADH-quinone oxidoreductase subunit J [Mycobacteriales bacterium]|nr:NADH-quinone oxidoreductase subunit J [Mycobacteriales bacterium]